MYLKRWVVNVEYKTKIDYTNVEFVVNSMLHKK